MAEEGTGLKITQIERESVPEGAEIAKVPTKPAEAISFKLIPLEVPEIPEVPAIPEPKPEIPPEFPREAPYFPPAEQLPPPPLIVPPVEEMPPTPEISPPIEVPEYVGVPTEIGTEEYLGVVWATDLKEAAKAAEHKFKHPPGHLLIDEYKKSPVAHFIFLKPEEFREEPKEEEKKEVSLPQDREPLTIPNSWVKQCPRCMQMAEGGPHQQEIICQICGTTVKKS